MIETRHLIGLTKACQSITKGIIYYLVILWFFGVGLSTLITLTKLPIKEEYYVIGMLVGVITISIPSLFFMLLIIKDKLKREGVE